jgi:hypothetical protein
MLRPPDVGPQPTGVHAPRTGAQLAAIVLHPSLRPLHPGLHREPDRGPHADRLVEPVELGLKRSKRLGRTGSGPRRSGTRRPRAVTERVRRRGARQHHDDGQRKGGRTTEQTERAGHAAQDATAAAERSGSISG